MARNPRNYYVYKITNKDTAEFYIGFRHLPDVQTLPENDLGVNYFTSGILKEDFKLHPTNYVIEILFVHAKERIALNYEQSLIKQFYKDALCRNRYYSPNLAKIGEQQNLHRVRKSLKKEWAAPHGAVMQHDEPPKPKRVWCDQRQTFVEVTDAEYEQFVRGFPYSKLFKSRKRMNNPRHR